MHGWQDLLPGIVRGVRQARTYVTYVTHIHIHGWQDLLPGIINQLGPDNLENLKKIAEQYQVAALT